MDDIESVGTADLDPDGSTYSAPDVSRAVEIFKRRADRAYMAELASRVEGHVLTGSGPCGIAPEGEEVRDKESPPGATVSETSTWFYGTVAVGVILPEGRQDEQTDIEIWTPQEVDTIQTVIVDGYASFADLHPEAELTFVIRFESAPPPWNPIDGIVECDHDPIVEAQVSTFVRRELIEQCAFPNLGYGFTTGREYVNYLRDELDTSWGVAIYVVDRSCTCDKECADPPWEQPICPRANAKIGGPSTVVWQDSAQLTLVHETGHLFCALDEYFNAGREPTGLMGYFKTANANSSAGTQGYFDGHGESGSCFMNMNPISSVCPYTRMCFGWGDRDADGLIDIIDTHPTCALNPVQAGSASGTAQATGVPRYTSTSGIRLNTIDSVECRVVIGEKGLTWLQAQAGDGGFDEPDEEFAWVLPPLPDGSYVVEARAVNCIGNLQQQPAEREVVVSGSGITNAPPIASFVLSARPDGIIGFGRPVVFDATFDQHHPYGVTDLEDAPSQLLVRWDFDADGIWDTSYSATKAIEYTYAASGVFTPRLEVLDTSGYTATVSRDLWVYPYSQLNFPPRGRLEISPWTCQLGGSGDYFPIFALDVSGVWDVETHPEELDVRWDFNGDGTWDSLFHPSKTAITQLVLPHIKFESDTDVMWVFQGAPNVLYEPTSALYVSGNYAFIGQESPPSLAIVEIPTHTLVKNIATSGIPQDMVVHPSGVRAVVSEGPQGLEWLTIDDPVSTVNLGSVGHSFTNARGMCIEQSGNGPLLYVASHDRVKMFNWMWDFYPPFFISEAVTPSAVDVRGRCADNRLYVANRDEGGLQVFDITDLGAPNLMGTLSEAGDARSLYEYEGLLAVCDANGRLLVVDATVPAHLVILKEYTGLSTPSSCEGSGAFVYVIEESGSRLYGLDLSIPDFQFAPLEETQTALTYGRGLYVSGNELFATGYQAFWTVLERVSVGATPRESLQWKMKAEVRDGDGATTDFTTVVWANSYNQAPSAAIAITEINGLTVTFSGAGSSDPDQGTTWDGYLQGRWDFDGDGIWDTGHGGLSSGRQCTYDAPGSYTAMLEVRDRFGVFDRASVEVTVE